LIYIAYADIYHKSYIGIRKKIQAQIHVFQKYFKDVYLTTYSGQMMYLLKNEEILDKRWAVTKEDCSHALLDWIRDYGIKNTYIRYDYSDKWFIKFMEKLHGQNVISVLEFPTIPYDGELSHERLILEDRCYRKKLYRVVDKCTTYSPNEQVFGIPCINLVNGVNLQDHPLKKRRNQDDLVLIAAAVMAKWHGYERVIQGMAEYYKNGGQRNITFRLAGEGSQLSYYQSLVEKCHLQDKVDFLGVLSGSALDLAYDQADIGVGSLGMYKTGIKINAPIKTREYCARAIPFLYGYDDNGFSGKETFALKVENNSNPINIEQVLDFYDQIRLDPSYETKMREYAEHNFTWEKILKPVIEYYRERE